MARIRLSISLSFDRKKKPEPEIEEGPSGTESAIETFPQPRYIGFTREDEIDD